MSMITRDPAVLFIAVKCGNLLRGVNTANTLRLQQYCKTDTSELTGSQFDVKYGRTCVRQYWLKSGHTRKMGKYSICATFTQTLSSNLLYPEVMWWSGQLWKPSQWQTAWFVPLISSHSCKLWLRNLKMSSSICTELLLHENTMGSFIFLIVQKKQQQMTYNNTRQMWHWQQVQSETLIQLDETCHTDMHRILFYTLMIY